MKTTARHFTIRLVVSLAVCAMLISLATAQNTGGNPTALPKQAASQLVAQARQAMKQGNLREADALIRQAESLNVKYSMLNFEDTPAKARRDFERISGTTTAKPSSRFAPWGSNQEQPQPDNPFDDYNRQANTPLNNTPPLAALPNATQPNAFGANNSALPNGASAFGTAPSNTAPNNTVNQVRFGSSPVTGQNVSPSQFEQRATVNQIEPLPKVNAFGTTPTTTPFGKPQVTAPPAVGKSPFAPKTNRTEPAEQPSFEFSKPAAKNSSAGENSIGFVNDSSTPSAFQPVGEPATPVSPAANADSSAQKQRAADLVRQARIALENGDRPTAERLAAHAQSLQVPESAFDPREDRPSLLIYDLSRTANTQPAAVRPAGGAMPPAANDFATPAAFQPHQDETRNVQVSGFNQATSFAAPSDTPMSQYEQGEQALAAGNRALANKLFASAWEGESELSPAARNRIKEHFMNQARSQNPSATTGNSLVDQAEAKQRMLAKQLESDVMRQQRNARDMLKTDPKSALETLTQVRATVEAADLKSDYRDRLLRRIDREIDETKKYIADNRSQIELDERNRSLLEELDREASVKLDVQQTLAELVDQFNTLNDEKRFREAELVVKKAELLAPKDPLVVQLKTTAMFIRRLAQNADIRERSERGAFGAWQSTEEAGIPFDDRNPIQFTDMNTWDQLTTQRRQTERNGARQRTKKEYEIEQKLRTPVLMQFNEEPLIEVVTHLSKVAGIDIYLDPRGLQAEGVASDTPVTLRTNNEISLKSALNVILGQLQLGFVIEDEMLKITSMSTRENDIYPMTYNVADLIIAIPNFGPQNGMGLQAEIQRAMNTATGTTNVGSTTSQVGAGGYAANQNSNSMNAHLNPTALGQVNASPPGGLAGLPGGLSQGAGGGAGEPDFDALIQLITSTVQPTTWDEVGGPGSIAPFATNLSLVVNQTQEVHEQLVDLLKQLRKNQDLQVTIEVRFIDLSDNFFERIGVDFNFLAYDNINNNIVPDGPGENEGGPSMSVGFDGANITGDFIFDQGSFETALPAAGGVFSAAQAASFGFAVLSDIEAYFFVQAVQSDIRSNTLQAPKVTLFNGQQAFVTNSTQTPFVTSVIPVVGDFAAAHQPVVVVLTEGSSMTVQAVVSPDKRYVRLTVVPFFSKIDKVETFTFTGSNTSSSDESEQDDENGGSSSKSKGKSDSREGTTIQLPTFSFQTVTTTVTVPDGGTVLLGGLKSLREARNENGVPLLSKIPYINRLFKNVGIGRETRSLMMMVTPRIIILEEEEAKLLGTRPGP